MITSEVFEELHKVYRKKKTALRNGKKWKVGEKSYLSCAKT